MGGSNPLDSETTTISALPILSEGDVVTTITPTFPPPNNFGKPLSTPEINYSVLEYLSKRDIEIEDREYTVVHERDTLPDGKIFGFREEGHPIEQTNLFQILPSSKYGSSAIVSILQKIDFNDGETLKQLIAEGERVMKHTQKVASGLDRTPVPLNDLMGHITINGYEYVITYQTPESSKYIKSALQESLEKLQRSVKH